jgi:isopentenyldiphosphate isomerase
MAWRQTSQSAPGFLQGPADDRPKAGAVELADLVDEANEVIGVAPRRRIRSMNLLHRGVGVLVRNTRGEVFVHRRTSTKDVFPGMYDMLLGGVVRSGETYYQAAARETQEELGIPDPRPRFLLAHLYQGPLNRAWVQLYEVRWDGPVFLQPEEIEWGTWMPEAELPSWARRVPVVPDGLEVFQAYLRWREAGSPPLPGRP